MQKIDLKMVRAAVEGVEEALAAMRRRLPADKKAELVEAACLLLMEGKGENLVATLGETMVAVREASGHDGGEAALGRLFGIACGRSGQCRHVAAFLLGCYNGTRFPFDLTDLRTLDASIFEDCLKVLRMDYQPLKEVHEYFADGGRRFEQLAVDWGIADRSGPPAETYEEPGGVRDATQPRPKTLFKHDAVPGDDLI